jgi:UDP-glucose 4-epimerase
MRVLVTGGAGFIGSHVAEGYRKSGHDVVVVDNLSSGHSRNMSPDIPLVVADITDRDELGRLFEDFRPQIVNHHAAQINVRQSVDDPVFDARVNILGLINLAELAVRHGIVHFIFASSGGAIYGEQESYPAAEDHPRRPVSPYGVSKLAGEEYLGYYRGCCGLGSVILRYANVYGPRQDPRGEAGVVAIFLTAMLSGETPVINGDGNQTRDYVYVEDVVRANMAVSRPELSGGIFNVGTGRETTVNEIFQAARSLAGADIPEKHGPPRKGEQRRSVIDHGRLAAATGWKPVTSLEEGLRRTCRFFQDKTKEK